MSKHISFILSILAALVCSGTAFAQAPANTPFPASITRIYFEAGTSSYTFSTNLTQGVSQGYVLAVSAGQSIYITKTGNASIEVLNAGDVTVGGPSSQPGPWGTVASQSGDYTLVLSGQGPVTISVYVPPAFYFSQRYATIASWFRQRIFFATGSTGTSFNQAFQQGRPALYTLGIGAGQQLHIQTQGAVTAAVLGPDTNPLTATSGQYGQWDYNIPATGDYTLVLSGVGSGSVSISIPASGAVPPQGTSVPPSGLTRIQFAPGSSSFSATANPQSGSPAQYVLGVGAGQTLYVSTSGNVSSVQVFDWTGNSVSSFTQPNGSLGFHISRSGDYRVVLAGSGWVSITFFIPPLY